LIVSCGTAVTIERITCERVWQGGAITLGLGLAARALHQNTAQLPYVGPDRIPEAWGSSTRPALEAGIFWGVVGAIKELLQRQRSDLPGDPYIIWTGGDAEILARAAEGTSFRISAELVLSGLSRALGEANERQPLEP
jgi:type III pantothenate kinase